MHRVDRELIETAQKKCRQHTPSDLEWPNLDALLLLQISRGIALVLSFLETPFTP